MNPIVETAHPLEFLLSEAPGMLSRENVSVDTSAGPVRAGQLVTGTQTFKTGAGGTNEFNVPGFATCALPQSPTKVLACVIVRNAELDATKLFTADGTPVTTDNMTNVANEFPSLVFRNVPVATPVG